MSPNVPAERDGRYLGVVDAQWRWTAISDELAELLEYQPAELIGRPADEVVVEADYDACRAALMKDGRYDGDAVLRSKSGRHIPYRYLQRRTFNSDGPVYVASGAPIGKPNPRRHDGTPVLVSYAEAAAIGNVTVRTVQRWVADGVVPAGGRPGSRRIPLDRLLEFLGAAALALLALLAVLCALACADVIAFPCPFMSPPHHSTTLHRDPDAGADHHFDGG